MCSKPIFKGGLFGRKSAATMRLRLCSSQWYIVLLVHSIFLSLKSDVKRGPRVGGNLRPGQRAR